MGVRGVQPPLQRIASDYAHDFSVRRHHSVLGCCAATLDAVRKRPRLRNWNSGVEDVAQELVTELLVAMRVVVALKDASYGFNPPSPMYNCQLSLAYLSSRMKQATISTCQQITSGCVQHRPDEVLAQIAATHSVGAVGTEACHKQHATGSC